MSGGRLVFLDVDGTLADEFGRVPVSAVAAIHTARARGHQVFLCTGRTLAELWPAVLDIGFDGLVAGAGAFVQVGDEVVARHTLPRAAVRHAAGYFADRGIPAYFQADEAIYASREVQAELRSALFGTTAPPAAGESREGPFGFVEELRLDADPVEADITKVIYLSSTMPIAEVREEFAGRFDVVPSSVRAFGPGSGELQLPGVHKAAGIDALLAHLGRDRADTLALGDSYNDLEMLRHVAVGIAMGDAPASVRAVADEVTGRVAEDGLRAAFLRHGLIAD